MHFVMGSPCLNTVFSKTSLPTFLYPCVFRGDPLYIYYFSWEKKMKPRLWVDPETGQQYVIRSNTTVGGGRKRGMCSSGDCVVGSLVFVAVLAVAAAVLASFALSYSLYSTQFRRYTTAGVIDNSPFAAYLDATNPLAMTLPNDLINYVGRTFTVVSQSAQAHTITLSAGTLTTTWDGANTVATFGGAIGDSITFHVFDHDKITIISNTNVVFS